MPNPTMMQYFEWEMPSQHDHWQRLSHDVDHLKAMGISHLWLPPASKAVASQDVGYGIYDPYDLGEFPQKGGVPTKYGSKVDYQAAIKHLKAAGIKPLADWVLNHRAGADQTETFPAYPVDPFDRQHKLGAPRQVEGWTKFTFPGRGAKYSDFKWDWTCFSGVDYDQARDETGIFMIKGFKKGWAHGDYVAPENGNYDYLMFADVDYSNDRVADEVIAWAKWMIQETGIQGCRLDAIKHVDSRFIYRLLKEIHQDYPKFYVVGEYWENDTPALLHYLEQTDQQLQLFDVALHFNFHQAAVQGADYDLRELFTGSLLATRPDAAVTFVDNHDSQPGQALESWVGESFKAQAYALILLQAQGLPCLFYGDYYGIAAGESYQGMAKILDKLLFLRRHHAYGEEIQYFDAPHCIGLTRQGDIDHPGGLALLVSNAGAQEKRMAVGPSHAGEYWVDCLSNQAPVQIDDQGYGIFTCSHTGLSVWLPKKD